MAYVDSSAFVKLVLGEPEHEALRAELDGFSGRVSSVLLGVESVRACARYGDEYAHTAREGLTSVGLIPLTEALIADAAGLKPFVLRSLDAVHLATALSLGDDLGALIAYDARLCDAADQHGLVVRSPV